MTAGTDPAQVQDKPILYVDVDGVISLWGFDPDRRPTGAFAAVDGILLALLCAVGSNLAFFFKHRGACEACPVDIRHPLRTAKSLYSSKWFTLGMIIGGAAWAVHVAAISLAPLSVVQAVLAGGVALLAVMAEKIFGLEVGPRQWWGLALTACGLILLGVTLPHSDGSHSSFSLPAMIAFEAGLFAVGTLLIMGKRLGGKDEHHGVMLAAASGILFGVCNVGVKALTGIVGDAVPVIAITGTAANISCIAGGIIVFGDPMPSDALGIAIQASAFVMVIVASALMPAPVRAAQAAPARA